MPTQLTGSAQAVALGEGYALRAPGVRGTANLKRPRSGAERSLSRGADDGTADLDAALRAANITEVRQVDLDLQPLAPADASRSLRSTDGASVLELQVPDLGPETGQLVLACDEEGVLTWHLPVDDEQQVQNPSARGAGSVKRFLIPATPVKATGAGAQRSLLGVIGKKLLKVLVYPVLDPVVGAISEFFAERWEDKKRPYGLRTFTPANFRAADQPALAPADWQHLGTGRALLFIHGTFSTAHGAFSRIPDQVFNTLHQCYEGRVFAFNHFTMSHDPDRNIEWLRQQLPQQALDVDIICHSRGGLVARALAERGTALGIAATQLRVRKIILVAVPNQGTLLAEPDHMVHMIDRLTTALNLFPTGPVTETLEVLVTAVKVIGHGALKSLQGLASMKPGGPFLKTLNQGGTAGADYYAIAANYEPANQGLRALLSGAANSVVDRVFQGAANDLVVPEQGVFETNGNAAFPLTNARLLRVAADQGVLHTTLFGHTAVGRQLVSWLT